MKVLILGGDGFIGSHLRDAHLARGDEVTVIDKACLRSDKKSNKYTYYNWDLSNPIERVCLNKSFSNNSLSPDFCYNCVAIANPDYYVQYPIETYDLDFNVNYMIDKMLHIYNIPYIQFSTSEVYGKKWTQVQTEENTDLIMGPTHKLRWIYATSKMLLEQLLLAHSQRGMANVAIVRIFNAIGPDIDFIPALSSNHDEKWKPRVLSCWLNDIYINRALNVVLPGTQQRCYTYIDDIIEALLSMVDNWDKCRGQVFNVGNPNNETTIINAAELVCEIYNKITKKKTKGIQYVPGEIFYGSEYEDSERRMFSIDKLQQVTNWTPKINLYDTWYKSIDGAIKYFGI